MIYTIIIILISAILTALSIFAIKKPSHAKALIFVNLSLFVLGAALMVGSHLIATSKIDLFSSDALFHSWAIDFYNLYYMIAMPAFILLLVINVIAAVLGLFDSKQRTGFPKTLRIVASISSSVFLMLIPFYGFITQNEYIEFYTYIMASGIGQALVIRVSDMIGLIKTKHNSAQANIATKGKLK